MPHLHNASNAILPSNDNAWYKQYGTLLGLQEWITATTTMINITTTKMSVELPGVNIDEYKRGKNRRTIPENAKSLSQAQQARIQSNQSRKKKRTQPTTSRDSVNKQQWHQSR